MENNLSEWIAKSKHRRKRLAEARGASEFSTTNRKIAGKNNRSADSDGLAAWITQSKQQRKQLSKPRSFVFTRPKREFFGKSLQSPTFWGNKNIPDEENRPRLKEELLLMGFDI
ncbi:MAG: hypothetical protein ACFFB3_22950, partial [Candidatus Hodarchaeota archaeon]